MASPGIKPERKGHVCPPSNAIHPSGRWESLFVYSFILKFTNLKDKISGFESPMDFEDALLSREPNDILTRILGRFILNLKPQTRNLSTDQISTTVMAILSEYLKSTERTVFWDDSAKANIDPFEGMECGFFAADWDFKLKILRQLVELQLQHSQEVKALIDRSWGVGQHKQKKEKGAAGSSGSDSQLERKKLELVPFGQDSKRERYWIADDSPRIYVSTNPWKITATFKAICSSREEYLGVIENLKASAPEIKKGHKRNKMESAHFTLIKGLEDRLENIDTELARVAKVRKKIEQNRMLMAQAELRETRTRRRAQKPDYVYFHQDSEDDIDEYKYQEEHDDDEFDDDAEDGKRRRRGTVVPTRRSTRTAVVNANGKREGSSDSSWGGWKGERRSSRLGFQDPFEIERPQKRARTEESTTSVGSVESRSALDGEMNVTEDGTSKVKVKNTGAAALKPNEVAMEQIAGKKRSKFWVYAVEPMPEASEPEGRASEEENEIDRTDLPGLNGHSANGCMEALPAEQSVLMEPVS